MNLLSRDGDGIWKYFQESETNTHSQLGMTSLIYLFLLNNFSTSFCALRVAANDDGRRKTTTTVSTSPTERTRTTLTNLLSLLPSSAHSCVLEICCWLLMTFRPTTTTPPFFSKSIPHCELITFPACDRKAHELGSHEDRCLTSAERMDVGLMEDDFVRMWRHVAAAGCFHEQPPKTK